MYKKDIIEFKNALSTNHLSLLSAGLSYYALFSLVPAITSIVLIYAWVSNPLEISGHMEKIRDLIPTQMFSIIKNQFLSLANKTNHTTLGFGAIFSLSLSLWGASKATSSFMESLNIIEGKRDSRHFFKSVLTSLGLTGLAVMLALLSLGVIIVIPVLSNILNLEASIRVYANLIGWGLLFILMITFLNLAYRYGPDRSNEIRRKWFYAGSIMATFFWLVISAGFSWYAKEFGRFNKNYGSLGAMIVLMTWFYLSSYSLLLGGQINEQIRRIKLQRTKKKLQSLKPVIKGLRPQT